MSNTVQIEPGWTVEQTLRRKPETSLLLARLRTGCVGCFMQKFCTIRDAADVYQLDLKELLRDLNQTDLDGPAPQPEKEQPWNYSPTSGNISSRPSG